MIFTKDVSFCLKIFTLIFICVFFCGLRKELQNVSRSKDLQCVILSGAAGGVEGTVKGAKRFFDCVRCAHFAQNDTERDILCV